MSGSVNKFNFLRLNLDLGSKFRNISSADLNDIITTTFGYAASCTNTPPGGNGYFLCISSGGMCWQQYIAYQTGAVYERQLLSDGKTWTAWEKRPSNADYLIGNTNVLNIDDTSIPPGAYAIADETISGNKPFSHGLLLVLRRYGSPVQLAIPAISGFTIKSRSYSSNWGNWQ